MSAAISLAEIGTTAGIYANGHTEVQAKVCMQIHDGMLCVRCTGPSAQCHVLAGNVMAVRSAVLSVVLFRKEHLIIKVRYI